MAAPHKNFVWVGLLLHRNVAKFYERQFYGNVMTRLSDIRPDIQTERSLGFLEKTGH